MTCRPLVLTSKLNQLKALSRRLNELSVEATRVGNAIDEVEEYSYQFNVKINKRPVRKIIPGDGGGGGRSVSVRL